MPIVHFHLRSALKPIQLLELTGTRHREQAGDDRVRRPRSDEPFREDSVVQAPLKQPRAVSGLRTSRLRASELRRR